MAENEDDWPRLIEGLRQGDPLTAREFCERYGAALHQLADDNLAKRFHRRLGPEDVVQSACRTFLRRARGGEFQLADSEALWSILCAITLAKIREQARFHRRRKRDLDREIAIDPTAGSSAGWDLIDHHPGPGQAAEFADQFEQVLALLDEQERQLVDLKLQECTNEEAAKRMGFSERSIRRILKRVQARLARALKTPDL